jgi:heterodisulfide reductase subunit A-like polyferredoxin
MCRQWWNIPGDWNMCENKINRVVVASCTPRTHEPLFKRTTKEAGVNPYLLEFVSIREQVSWVHMKEPEIATEKAKDLVKMGVAKAALLEEGQEIRLPVKTDCLIIGGGMAGMNAALSVADQGFNGGQGGADKSGTGSISPPYQRFCRYAGRNSRRLYRQL